MNSNPKKLKLALFVVTMSAAGVFIGWLASRTPPQELQPPSDPDGPQAAPRSNRSLFAPVRAAQTQATVSNALPPETAASNTNVVSDWEEKLDAILREPGGEDATARQLLELFPRLPEAGQIEAARHIANLISDEDYPKLARYLVEPSTSPEVVDELFADLLNRPDSVKLPALLEIARNAKHPNAADAKDILKLFLEEDYGDDWKLWEQKLAAWLKDNP